MARKTYRKNDYHYIENLGIYLPRVTSILNVIAKPQLVNWAAKTAAELAAVYPQAAPEEIVSKVFGVRDAAGNIGSRVHNHIKANPTDKLSIEIAEPDCQLRLQAYLNFLKMVGFKKLILSEQLVWSVTYGYSGIMDHVFETLSGEILLVDYKTGSGLYDEVGLQLASYEHALLELKLVDRIDRKLAVQLKENGTPRVQEYSNSFDDFLHALALWKWKHKIK
jgi:hypothetical protein